MCYKLDSEYLLMNYFSIHRDFNEVRVSNLKKIRNKIEQDFNYQIYIDITYDSLIQATSNHFFNMEGTKITVNDEFNAFGNENIEQEYNWILPKDYNAKIKKILSEI